MATIATDVDVVTLVNVFSVSRERQQRLVELLVEATRTVMNQEHMQAATQVAEHVEPHLYHVVFTDPVGPALRI